MLEFKRLATRRALFILAFGGLTGTAAGAGTIHRLAVTQSTGAGSLGSTAFLQTSSSGGAVQAQVGSSILTSLPYPFGIFGLYNGGQIGFGVVGLSTTSYGVAGQSTSTYASLFGLSGGGGPAVEGMNPSTGSTAAPAGFFKATGGDAIDATTSHGYAIDATNNSANQPALFVSNYAGSGATIAGNGGASSYGLIVNSSGGQGAYVNGYGEGLDSYSAMGNGLYGEADSTATPEPGSDGGAYAGVYGQSSANTGVYGESDACPDPSCDVPFGTGDLIGAGVSGYSNYGPGIVGNSSANTGVYAFNLGGTPTLYVENALGTDSSSMLFDAVADQTKDYIYGDAVGNLVLSGTVTSMKGAQQAVSRNPNAQLVTYSAQQAEATVEDVGAAHLVNGSANVPLATDFRQTINEAARYLVFLTPDGDTKGLYVASKSPAGFVVRETQGGRGSFDFDYRIVAQPYGIASERLPHFQSKQKPMPHHKLVRSSHAGLSARRLGPRKNALLARALKGGPMWSGPPVPPNLFKVSATR